MKFLIVGLIFVGAVVVLVSVAMSSSVPVLEIHQLKSAYAGGSVQVDGGKILAIKSLSPLDFTVCPGGNPDAAIRVVSDRTVPENFLVGRDVSLRGKYDSDTNTLTAYRISTQCPSKYEASKEGDSGTPGEAPGGAGSSSGLAQPAAGLIE